ncbi:MAG: hypothetical protein PHQ69_08925, partial [Bacteroidales bacterium]|nr:hypothetical protein [Bacteroidales bacterium]
MTLKIRNLAIALIACLLSLGVAAQTPPAGWTPVTTDANITVMGSAALFNNVPIDPTDWIGAFYLMPDGTERCGGAVQRNSGPFSVTIFGDDGLSPEKDGFTNFENVIWKLYRTSEGEEYYGDAYHGGFITTTVYPTSDLTGVDYISFSGSPSGDHLITGKILKQTGTPLRSAKVETQFYAPAKTDVVYYTDHLGTYRLYVTPEASGTITPSKDGWGFIPQEREFTALNGNLPLQDFTAVQLQVSGTVLLTSGTPLAGVTISFVSDDGLVTITESTNASGYYELDLMPGTSGMITPSKTDYSGWPFITYYFDPANRHIDNLSASLTGQDFTASDVPFYVSLCGTLTDNEGAPLDLISVTFQSSETSATETVTTNADGNYCISVAYGESGTLTPTDALYVFDPVSITVTDVEENLNDLDFIGTIPITTWSVCGTVVDDGEAPIADVMVWFESVEVKTTVTTHTAADGTYCLEGIEEGTAGIVFISKTGYSFTPPDAYIPSLTGNMTDVDFVGTLDTYTISGVVTDNQTKGLLEGVTVTLTGFDPVITGSDGAFSFTAPYGFTGTLTPEKEGYSFAPASRSYTGLAGNQTDQNFTGALFTYLISGTITLDGTGMENIPVTFSNNAGIVYTDASGYYSISVTHGYSGTATPALEGYYFTPASYSYVSVEGDLPDQDFAAAPNVFTISGMITLDGAGLENVAVNFSNGGGTVTTDATGFYTQQIDLGWSGVVTPVLEGYNFAPATRTYTDVAGNYSDQDYLASVKTYLVSGTITEAAKAGVPGVTVTFGEGIDAVLSNSSGYYEQYVPHGFSGIITPSKEGWIFTPETRMLSEVTAATPDQDFTGEVETFVVSGFITNTVTSGLINAVSIAFTGVGNTSTNASGFYAMEVPYGYTGVITPTKPGFTFAPETIQVTNVTTNLPTQNFEGTEIMYTLSGVILDPAENPVDGVLLTFSNGGGSVLTDETGAYSLQVAYGYSGTASPLKTGYLFNPVNRTYNFVTEDALAEDYVAAPVPPESFDVSGSIVDGSGNPMAGVSVIFTNGGGTVSTDANGAFTIEIFGGYSGEVIPSKPGYGFSPVSIPIVYLSDDLSGLDFIGTVSTLPPGWGYDITESSHLISVPNSINPTINGMDLMPGDWIGVFFPDGATEVCGGAIMWNGISSVAVTAFGDDATTAAKDGFSENEILNWKVYSQTAGMSFDAVVTYNAALPQHDGLFHSNGLSALTSLEATGLSYTLSGTVHNMDGGDAMSGVMVTLNNGGGSSFTDGSGYYEIEVLPNWTGTATPFLMGYHFTPQTIDYVPVTADLTDQDYTGAINYYTISGYITNASGIGMPGVTIFFENDGGSSVSFPDGFYTRTVPYGYTGTAYPSLEGYSFAPETYVYSLVADNYADQDYTGTLANVPPGWGFDPTLESHVISLPLGANPNINGVPLFPGDWIGVFFMDDGVEKCGGAIEWDGNVNVPLVAYGDDETTPDVKDGFGPNEEFIWKVYSYAADMAFEDITVIYDNTTPYTSDNIFYPNGLSALLSLNGTTDVMYTISGVVTDVADGTPMENVLVDFGAGGEVYTDATGYYEIDVLFGWIGSAVPVFPRYSFDPASFGFYQVIGDQTDINFEGTRYPFPPGWEYEFTDTEHTVSVISFANPTIDDTPLVEGDFIGIFYYDAATDDERCAGYAEWTGANTAVVAYGDDATTAVKDGLTVGEPFRWKVYSWDLAMEYEAIANYDLTPPYLDGFFTVNGLSRVVNIYADPLTIFATATPETICYGATSQLEVSAAGGNGLYAYFWTPVENLSNPLIANPVATLTETTTFTVTVSTYQYTEMQTVTVNVHPLFEVTGGDDQTICYNTAPVDDLYAVATGGAGNYSYQWLMADGEVWTAIEGA